MQLDRRRCVYVLILTTACWAGMAIADNNSSPPARGTSEPSSDGPSERWREGNALQNVVGEFQAAGERVHFRPLDQKIKLTVLENLALERVSRVLDETRTPPTWSVTGTITEFHGGNYLLLERAVVKAKRANE